MKITLLFLLLLNGLFFGWSQWVAKTPLDLAVATPEPDAEPLQLYAEAFPDKARAEREAIEKVARDERLAAQRAAREQQEQAAAQAESEATAAATSAPDNTSTPDTVPSPTSGDTVAAQVAPPATQPPAPQADSPTDAGDTVPTPVTRETALAALDQLASARAPVETGTGVVTLDGPANTRCVQLGPFVNLRNAAQAASALRDAGLEPAQRLEEAQVWVGHWVHLPPAESRAAAVTTVEQLRADGVSDIYIEPSGELRHSISLGLFSDAERAELRAGKIRKLGVKPQIRDRFRDGSVYWVDVDLASGQNVDPARFEGAPGRAITLKERECAAEASR